MGSRDRTVVVGVRPWDSSGPVNNLVTLALPHLRLWTGGNYRRLTIVQSSMHEMGLSTLSETVQLGC